MSKQILRRIIMVALVAVLLISGGYAMKTANEYQQEVEMYETAQTEFITVIEEDIPLAELPVIIEETEEVIPEEVEITPNITVDFEKLSQTNEQIVAWLHIPDTTISYPVLQGDNNQGYLYTTYDGAYSSAGSIFVDYRIEGDFTEQNTIIYGHNMNSGTMFGTLKEYRDENYAAEHPYFFVLTEDGYLRYEICNVVVTHSESAVYDFDFTEENSLAEHMGMLDSISLYDIEVEQSENNKIVTLSTCTGAIQTERLVVVGVLDE